MRDYSITPATRKMAIHTLDLVNRGKWINPKISHPYFTLNFTSDNPVFTGMGWSGIASITIDLAGLRAAGENIDNPHNPKSYMYDLDKIYKNTLTEKDVTPDQVESAETVFEIEDTLAWFDDKL